MTKQATLLYLIIFFALMSSCTSEKDLSGTYYWSTNPFYKFSNTFNESQNISWPKGTVYHSQDVYLLPINTLQINKGNQGYNGSLRFSTITKKQSATLLHGVRHTYDKTTSQETTLNNIRIKGDTLNFEIKLRNRIMTFYLTKKGNSTILSMGDKPRIDVNSQFNITIKAHDINFTHYNTYANIEELESLNDALVDKQIQQFAENSQDPNDPTVLFYNQFKTDQIVLF